MLSCVRAGEIIEMMEVVKENKWDVELCPEVMGKKNVFGSIDEIGGLVEATGCGACIDIAHVLARYAVDEWEKVLGWLNKLDKDVVLICESPDAVGDSKVGLRLWEEFNH